jgi:hypothetical protein
MSGSPRSQNLAISREGRQSLPRLGRLRIPVAVPTPGTRKSPLIGLIRRGWREGADSVWTPIFLAAAPGSVCAAPQDQRIRPLFHPSMVAAEAPDRPETLAIRSRASPCDLEPRRHHRGRPRGRRAALRRLQEPDHPLVDCRPSATAARPHVHDKLEASRTTQHPNRQLPLSRIDGTRGGRVSVHARLL